MKNKIILITGATGGIGSALSQRCATQGATVILLGRNIKKLEMLYDTIEKENQNNVLYSQPIICPFDLAKATIQDYQTVHDSIEKEFRKLDALVHIATDLGLLTPIQHYPSDQWMRVIQVNLNAAFFLTQTTLPLLKKSTKGTIIFSTCDETTARKAYWGAYAVSKLAIEGFSEILAKECETHTNIQVHTVNPGKVRTKLRHHAYPAEDQTGLFEPNDVLEAYLRYL